MTSVILSLKLIMTLKGSNSDYVITVVDVVKAVEHLTLLRSPCDITLIQYVLYSNVINHYTNYIYGFLLIILIFVGI